MIANDSNDSYLQWDWLIKKGSPVSYTFILSQNYLHQQISLPGSHNPELPKTSPAG